MEWFPNLDDSQTVKLIHDQWPIILFTLIAGVAFTLWLVVSGAGLALWALRTRLGWDHLTRRPIRVNYLQLPVVIVLFAAFLVVLSGLMSFGAMLARQAKPSDAVQQAAALLASLIMAGATIYFANFAFVGGRRGLGLGRPGRAVGRDVLTGLAGFLVVTPAVLAVLHLTMLICDWTGIKPTPHPLLVMLSETRDPWTVALLIVGAVVGAPLWEELFFRGIVQSFFVRFFRVMMPPKGRPMMALLLRPPEFSRLEAQEAVARARALGESPPADLGVAPEPEPAGLQGQPGLLSPIQEGRRAIAAIVVTSLIFAAIHPPTSIPAIFVLALALGYVYETTGSLVCTMTMHAAFNGLNIAMLLGSKG